MKAVKNFKRLVDPHKSGTTMQSILGEDIEPHFVEPPMEIDGDDDFPMVGFDANAQSEHGSGGIRRALGRHGFWAGLHDRRDDLGMSDSASLSSRPEHSPVSSQRPSGVFEPERKNSGSIRSGRSLGKADIVHDARHHSESASPLPLSRASSATTKRSLEGTRGHARDPLEEDFPYLSIGPSTFTGAPLQEPSDFNIGSDPAPLFTERESAEDNLDLDPSVEAVPIVSESPGAAEFDIYETAYRKELERINSRGTYPGNGPKVYLTRRVEDRDDVIRFVKDKAIDLQTGSKRFFSSPAAKSPSSAFNAAVSLLRSQIEQKRDTHQEEQQPQQQQQQQQQHEEQSEEAQQTDHQGSHPPRSSLSSQSIPGPEASNLEATGVSATDTQKGGDSTAQLRRLLGRVRDKCGE